MREMRVEWNGVDLGMCNVRIDPTTGTWEVWQRQDDDTYRYFRSEVYPGEVADLLQQFDS